MIGDSPQDDELCKLVEGYTAHLSKKLVAACLQPPLLAETVPCGVLVSVAHRSQDFLKHFHSGLGFQKPDEAHGKQILRRACICAISETSLAHYTKKPKPLAEVVNEVKDGEGTSCTSSLKKALHVNEAPDEKYWKRRYNFFSRFDEGIQMDLEAWFEVTPESIARHLADRMPYKVVVDGTCGVGGNAIQFALNSQTQSVIGVDMDPERLKMAEHNAAVYGVQKKVHFVCNDFVLFAEEYASTSRRVDAVFISPPWGGPGHLDSKYFSLKDVPCPDIVRLFQAAVRITSRVVLYLPRHIDLHEVACLASEHDFAAVEVEKIFFEYPVKHLKLVVVYFTQHVSAMSMCSSLKKVHAPGTRQEGNGSSGPRAVGKQANDRLPGSGSTRHNPNVLLSPLELAGPVIRAVYCHGYLGGIVRQLAVKTQIAARCKQKEAPRSKEEGGKRCKSSNKSAEISASASSSLDRQILGAITKKLDGPKDATSVANLGSILAVVPLREALRLLEELVDPELDLFLAVLQSRYPNLCKPLNGKGHGK